MANIYDMSDVWADGATTFTGIGLNVTDTASSASSLLMDLQVGGASKFKIGKDASVDFSGSAYSSGINISASGYTIYLKAGNANHWAIAGGSGALTSLGSTQSIGFNGLVPDLILARDAANTLAQRNGTNAQTFNLYNTYTDGSNYERGFMKWNGINFDIGTEAAGTGTQRQTRLLGSTIQFLVGAVGVFQINSSGNIVFNNNNSRDIGVAGGVARTIRVGTSVVNSGYDEFTEMTAPAAGSATSARIFAEDDGTGKTRLMVQFGTGAAQQIAIEP